MIQTVNSFIQKVKWLDLLDSDGLEEVDQSHGLHDRWILSYDFLCGDISRRKFTLTSLKTSNIWNPASRKRRKHFHLQWSIILIETFCGAVNCVCVWLKVEVTLNIYRYINYIKFISKYIEHVRQLVFKYQNKISWSTCTNIKISISQISTKHSLVCIIINAFIYHYGRLLILFEEENIENITLFVM